MKKLAPLFLIAASLLFACRTTRTTTSATGSTTAPILASGENLVMLKPAGGVYAPGDAELAAIRKTVPEASAEQLKEGHLLYTAGACIGCHGAYDIYPRASEKWKGIIDEMAVHAQISEAQKTAVYNYVMSVKAVQGE